MTSDDKPEPTDADTADVETTDAETTDAEATDAEGVDVGADDTARSARARPDTDRTPRTKSAKAAGTRAAQQAEKVAEPADAPDTTGTDTTGADTTGVDDPESEPRRPGKVSTPAGRGRQLTMTLSARSLIRALGVLLVIGVLVVVGVLGWLYAKDEQRLAAFDDTKAISSEFTTKLVNTMSSSNVGDMKNVLGPLSTGEFHDNLARQTDETQKAVQNLNLTSVKPNIRSVSVASFDDNRARTAVLVEVTGNSAIAPNGGNSLMLVSLDLQKHDGKWLVAKLTGAQAGLGQQQGGGSGANAAVPTPTPGQAQAPGQPQAPAPAPAG